MKNTTAYKDGSVISYAEYGDKTGFPLLINHGLIASIDDHHLFGRLLELHARLICIARPGYGESSPYILRNIAEFAELVEIVVDHLKLDTFDVLGMSSGAPYSYALGYKFPDRVRNIYIFSGIPALYDLQIQGQWPFPLSKTASITEMQTLARELFFSNLTAEDRERNEIRDSMKHNCFGIAQDLKIRCIDWGFSLSDVKQKVYMEHSRTDDSVPFITAELTANLLPHCTLGVRDGEHFSGEAFRNFIESTILEKEQSKAVEPSA